MSNTGIVPSETIDRLRPASASFYRQTSKVIILAKKDAYFAYFSSFLHYFAIISAFKTDSDRLIGSADRLDVARERQRATKAPTRHESADALVPTEFGIRIAPDSAIIGR